MHRPPPRLPISRIAGALTLIAAVWIIGVAPATAQESAEHRWLGPDLEVVPLTDAEVVEFLRTASVVKRESIAIGINGIDRLTLEKDGITLRAGFRTVDVRRREARIGDEFYLLFRDSYMFEPAAYRFARHLGIDNVPPAVRRRLNGVDGSLQIWVEDLFNDDEDSRSPDALGWARQLWTMKFFDSLVYNVDRNPGNVKVDRQYRLWMIDHTRAFQRKADPFQMEYANHVRRDIWETLKSLDRDTAEELFDGTLEYAEITYLLRRTEALLTHIDVLIAERSEPAVIY